MRHGWMAALALGALSGCAGSDDNEPEMTVGAEESGSYRMMDPVTGRQVDNDTPYRIEHAGVRYYFESVESMERFGENPSAYVDSEGKILPSHRAEWERERAREVR